MSWLRHPLSLLAIVLVLIINLSFLWHSAERSLSFGIFAGTTAAYIILIAALLIRGIMHLLGGLEAAHQRMTTGVIVIALFLVTWFPAGLFPPSFTIDGAALVAEKDGIGRCETMLSLHDDGRARQHSTCFGFEHYTGTYTRAEDTLHFDFGTGSGSFALITRYPEGIQPGLLEYYRSPSDTAAIEMSLSLAEGVFQQQR
jgi:hypothetical protein